MAQIATAIPYVYPNTNVTDPLIRCILRARFEASVKFVAEQAERERYLATHHLRISATVCTDGRTSDFPFALGLLGGIMIIYRDPGSKDFRLEDAMSRKRLLECHREFSRNIHLHLATAHYSSSLPGHGCAAWMNNTSEYMRSAKALADSLNAWATTDNTDIISVCLLIDTDDDSLTVYGSHGSELCTKSYARHILRDPEGVYQTILKELRNLFPVSWKPLARMTPVKQEFFYREFAELLVSNARFVANVHATKRPIEKLEHAERMILIGGPLETTDHNAAFLIEDRGKWWRHLGIGMRVVLKNVLDDARNGKFGQSPEQWRVPILISVHHRSGEAYPAREYARGIRTRLEETLSNISYGIANALHPPESVFREEIGRNLRSHVAICTTIHDRATRHPVVVD